MSYRRLRSCRSAAIALLVPLTLVGFVVAVGASGTRSLEDTVTLILCNLVIVLGLQVFIGNSGVYSFGQIAFAAAGGYITALMTLPATFAALQTPGLPQFIAQARPGPLAAIVTAALACGALAALVGLPLMRTSTLAIPISTFAFLIVSYNVLANWNAVTGGSGGLTAIPTTTTLYTAGLWAALAVVLVLTFKRSAAGYRLQATREDEVAARSIGINVTRERLAAFCISAMLCGAGGALAVHQSGVLTPETFYFGATVTTLTMLVLGGTRSVLGAVSGAIAVAAVNEVLSSLGEGTHLFGLVSFGETPGLAAIGLGLILLVTIIALPDGLSGGREADELGCFRRRPATPRSSQSTLATAARDDPSSATRDTGLIASGISVAFAGLQALNEVDLSLAPGEALGLIGPNGAGKTTLVNVLSGFQKPDAGTVLLNGVDLTSVPPPRIARAGLARTFQSALPFPQLSVLETVAVGAMGVGVKRRRAVAVADQILARLELGGIAGQITGKLPPARQRLVGIARALATSPRYLLLDEPAAGLNESEREELVRILHQVLASFGCGALLIEHDMNVVMDLCPRIQVLEDGATLLVAAPQEIQRNAAVIEAYLGSSFLAAANA